MNVIKMQLSVFVWCSSWTPVCVIHRTHFNLKCWLCITSY